MRIVHVSYARIKSYTNPTDWLHKIDFFTGVVESMALDVETFSIHCIDHTGVVKKDNATYYFFKRTLLQVLFPREIHKLIRTLQPDAVIVHGLAFPWQVIQLRRALTARTRIYAQNHAETPLRFHKRFLQRWADQKINGYFFTAAALAQSWIERRQISSPAKIHEVMEVSSRFYPMDRGEARRHTPVEGVLNFLWVGRLDANKDPRTLVQAFMEFLAIEKRAKLYVIFQQDHLLREIHQLLDTKPGERNQIVLVGKVDHDSLIYWYNSVDFIISTSHYEGSGIAVCEAMSCGCIPVLTDIASFRMMTGEGTCGLLFKPGNVHELTERLITCCSLDVASEKRKVLSYFHDKLSFQAIASKMIHTAMG